MNDVQAPVASSQVVAPQQSVIQGPKVMLVGDSNTGKTTAIRSLVALGIETFVLATEPGIEKILGDIPADKLHWNYLPPTPFNVATLQEQQEKINTMSYEQMTRLVTSRNEFRQMLDVMSLTKNFKCQRTGQTYGDIYKWDNKRAFVVDSLSGLTQMQLNSWLGTKITMGPPDYNITQKGLLNLVMSWCMALNCWFLLTAHTEKELNETTGSYQVMASTVGKALAPQLPKYFDEVIHTKRDGVKFSWSNITPNYLLKARMLPLSDALQPDFVQLNAAWRTKTTPR